MLFLILPAGVTIVLFKSAAQEAVLILNKEK